MLLNGQQIGHYRLLRVLGRGGMGIVYLAEDLHVERQVAIKVIRSDISLYSNDEEFRGAVRLFRREANAIAMLDHPHILSLYECGEQDINGTSSTYLVMPYRPEGSLADVLQRLLEPKQLLAQDVVHIVQQAADALQHAHAHQIIHRDVKPSNFLLRNRYEDGTLPDLLLTDFGIAKLNTTSENGPSTTIRGTATYMAPEQWTDRPEPATDQYALAIMAYELLTGRPPFQGNQQQLMYQHFHVQPAPPSTIDPSISQDIDAVLLRALAKTAADRFPSISAFSQAFQEAVLRPNQIVSLANSQTLGSTIPAIDPNNFDPNNNGAGGKSSRDRIRAKSILLIALVLLIIVGSFGLYYGADIKQKELEQANATGTAQAQYRATSYNETRTAQVNATSTYQAQIAASATATAQTISNATATAQAISNATAQASATAGIRSAHPNQYPPYGGILALYDSLSDNSQGNRWDEGTGCAFTNGAYHVSESQKDSLNLCIAQNTSFSNFVYEAQMTIISGDCGGLIFRADGSQDKFYYFHLCQDGTYDLFRYDSASSGHVLKSDSSSAITTGLNQSNLIAVVAIGNTFDLYVNRQKIASVDDSTYSRGQIGVAADSSSNSTEVVFSNVRVWTW